MHSWHELEQPDEDEIPEPTMIIFVIMAGLAGLLLAVAAVGVYLVVNFL